MLMMVMMVMVMMMYRAADVRLPKLTPNKTAAEIAERRQVLRAKQAQVYDVVLCHTMSVSVKY